MLDFKAKMHEIRFLQTPPGELLRSPTPPDPVAAFKGPTSKGRVGKKRQRNRRGRKGKGERGRGRDFGVAPVWRARIANVMWR